MSRYINQYTDIFFLPEREREREQRLDSKENRISKMLLTLERRKQLKFETKRKKVEKNIRLKVGSA